MTYEYIINGTEYKGELTKYSDKYKIPAESLNEGEYTVTITVKDSAGNEANKTVTVKKDTTVPQITEVKYQDKSGKSLNNKWTNEKADIVVECTDANGDISVSGIDKVTYEYIINGTEYKGELTKYSDKYKIPAESLNEGEYTVTITVVDNVGLESNKSVNVKKDTTKEDLSLTYAEKGKWTNNPSNIEIAYDVTKEEIETAPVVSLKWKIGETGTETAFSLSDNKVGKSTITAGSLPEGNYMVYVTLTDEAGNTISKSVNVKKDTTKESLRLTYAEDGKWTNNPSNIKIEYDVTKEGIETAPVVSLKWKIGETGTETAFTDSVGTKTGTYAISSTNLPEGNYTVYVTLTDEAGNPITKSVNVKKDTTKESLTLKYAENGKWTNNPSNIEIAYDVTKNGIETAPVVSLKWKIGETGKENSFSLSDNKVGNSTITAGSLPEGDYMVYVTLTDEAGNTISKSVNVKKDVTRPTGSVKIAEIAPWTTKVQTIDFGRFFASKVNVRIETADKPDESINKSAGVKSVEYIRTETLYTEKQLIAITNGWITLDSGRDGFISDGNENLLVYVKITDNAGNVTYISSNGVVTDTTKPEGKLTVVSKADNNDIFVDDIVVAYEITDPIVGNATSALGSVTCTVTNKDTGYVSTPVDVQVLGNTATPSRAELLAASTYSGQIKISKADFNTNNIVVELTAKDNAGNIMNTQTLELQLDATNPVVNVSYDNDKIGGYEKYFDAPRTMTVDVIERNFDASDVLLYISKNGVETVTDGSTLRWSKAVAGVNGDETVNTAVYTFSDDADYKVRIECMDKAGNVCDSYNYTGEATKDFTIDKIDPVISVSNVDAYNQDAKTVSIIINEHNFNTSDVKILVTKMFNGNVLYSDQEVTTTWTDDEDAHYASISFPEDGDYTFSVDYSDMAGRSAESYKSDKFTIDNTNPELICNISAENKNIANKKDLDFVFEYYDVNCSLDNISYSLTTLTGIPVTWVASEPIEVVNADGIHGYKFDFTDIASNPTLDDGIYILTVAVKDLSGRSNTIVKEFSVNRGGSAYDCSSDSYLSEILGSNVQSVENDIEIQVMNPDEVTAYQVNIFNSQNQEIILTEGTDYTWSLVSNPEVDGVYHYLCVINKEVFAENGTYRIQVLTKDEADDSYYEENAAMISNEDATNGTDALIFTVDNVAPEVIILGVKDGEKYDMAQEIKIDYSDANDIAKIVIVRTDDEGAEIDRTEYNKEQLAEMECGVKAGRLLYTVEEYNDYQNIRVIVVDEAGNGDESTSAVVRILVSSNFWVRFVNNTGAFVGTIVGIVVIVGAIVFFIIRKKKKASK